MAKILIVDDSKTEVLRFTRILEDEGHEVLSAENGEEGIALAKRAHPDLILMDIVMPGVNGFQATRHLSRDEQTRDIPIIIVTTKDQDTDKAWGKRQGARAYLSKPVPAALLIETVKSVSGAG